MGDHGHEHEKSDHETDVGDLVLSTFLVTMIGAAIFIAVAFLWVIL